MIGCPVHGRGDDKYNYCCCEDVSGLQASSKSALSRSSVRVGVINHSESNLTAAGLPREFKRIRMNLNKLREG